MKFLVRFLLPLALVLGTLVYISTPVVDRLIIRWFTRDLDIRARLIANILEDPLAILLADEHADTRVKIQKILKKITQDERLLAIGICDEAGHFKFKTDLFPDELSCSDQMQNAKSKGAPQHANGGDLHIALADVKVSAIEPAPDEIGSIGAQKPVSNKHFKVVLLHDLSFASKRSDDTKTYLYLLFLSMGLLTSAITVVAAKWSRASWVRSVRQLVGGVRASDDNSHTWGQNRDFLPILKDLKGLVRDLETSNMGLLGIRDSWDAKALRTILKEKLSGEEIIVVSNRQPYIHNKVADKIEVSSPASGLVTALEPIMKACSGVWIAHGNGTADREVVDVRGRIAVPPYKPQYEIHRIWLDTEEERGYYYGLANEGIWPLCHIAHTRPIFRQSDWEQYVKVNQRFVEAILKDSKTDDPVVLVQDYHFALVPQLLRSKLPNATIITFWHIPWPNPESFGICPWRKEILEGLLGSSIVGFHTQFHCNNFIESCDRYLESRVDRETDAISYKGEITEVRPYPISIEWAPERLMETPSVSESKRLIQQRYGLSETIKIGVGVDRLDYTKGLIERFRSVARLLELFPKWIGRFTFVQIAAPSRSSITAYQRFACDLKSVVDEINARFGRPGYVPIILQESHHEPKEVFTHLRAADLCMVTSLHDGMNLVAKEFVSSRDDEQGVLILSMFAGASRELAEALIVNPYDADICAFALESALVMPTSEQRDRMRTLRTIVKEYNVYRWAGQMLLDAARMRRRHQFMNRVKECYQNADQRTEPERLSLARAMAKADLLGGKGMAG